MVIFHNYVSLPEGTWLFPLKFWSDWIQTASPWCVGMTSQPLLVDNCGRPWVVFYAQSHEAKTRPWGKLVLELTLRSWDHHGNLTNYPLPSMDSDLINHAEELVPWPDLVGLAGSLGTLRRLKPSVVAFIVHWWIWCVNVLYPNHPACRVTKLTNCFPF
jgi:hypothetical protein